MATNNYFRRLVKAECELGKAPEVLYEKEDSVCYLYEQLSSLDETQQFNQLKYMEYLQLEEERGETSFIDVLLDGVKTPPKDCFSDECILEDMNKKYGEMDTRTHHFKKLFKTYKEGFMESAVEYTKKAEDIKNDVQRDGTCSASNLLQSIDQKIKEIFTEEEQELYGVLDPKKNKSKADWFDLSRPTEKWANHVKDKLQFERTLKRPLTKEKLNLAVFDLKYDEFPKHIVKYLDLGYPDFILSLPKLCQTFSKIISKFPNGVDEKSFLRAFKKQENYEIPLNRIEDLKMEITPSHSSEDLVEYGGGQLSFEDIMPGMKDIFLTLEPRHGSLRKRLLFPSALQESIGSREEMEIKIVHYIIISFVLNGKEFVCLDKIPVLLKMYFNVSFNFKDWGYRDLLDFMEKFFVFKSEELQLISFMHKLPNYVKQKTLSRRSNLQHFLLSKLNNGQEKFKLYRKRYEDAESAKVRKMFEED